MVIPAARVAVLNQGKAVYFKSSISQAFKTKS